MHLILFVFVIIIIIIKLRTLCNAFSFALYNQYFSHNVSRVALDGDATVTVSSHTSGHSDCDWAVLHQIVRWTAVSPSSGRRVDMFGENGLLK